MVSEIYNNGTLVVTSRVIDDGDRGAIIVSAIKDGTESVVEKIVLHEDQEKKLVKEFYLDSKQVFVKQGFASYCYGDVCLRIYDEGLELMYKNIFGDFEYASLGKIVNFLFVEMAVAREAKDEMQYELFEEPTGYRMLAE